MTDGTSPTTPQVRASRRRHLTRWLCIVAAVLPFLSLYAAHYVAQEGATGFIQEDQPKYTAHGRAIFERGNGLSYPNPYDPSPEAPAIYFHWFLWLLGFGVVKLGFDPGLQYVTLGVIAALWCGWATLRLVETVLPDPRYRSLLFFVAMWGGGVLCVAAVVANVFEHRPMTENILAFDPGDGLWFLSWGRNVIFTTEALYHAIMASVWLAVLRNRPGLALLGGALLAATHPFSGLQVLLILFVWFGYRTLADRNRSSLTHWLTTVALLACFLGYNVLFLESFAQHRAMLPIWTTADYLIPVSFLLLAQLPIGLCAVWPRRHAHTPPNRTIVFLVICCVVSLLLAKHEWFVRPHQPIHFTRGYFWMSLCLLALPTLQAILVALRRRISRVGVAIVVAAVMPFAVLDNAAFIAWQWRGEPLGVYLSPASRDMFRWINDRHLAGVLLTMNGGEIFLSATYTAMRPYIAIIVNTPDFLSRGERASVWLKSILAGYPSEDIPEIDYLILPNNTAMAMARQPDWMVLYKNDQLALWKRIARSSGANLVK
ncbi:MAG: hypothetical protein K8S99_04690 [Planctomycetes bacterium]|nr:hypothetical protein [Planctomycetota bacterium]